MEGAQIKLIIERALYQIHLQHYLDVILPCQVNNLLIKYFFDNCLNIIKFILIISNSGSPLESPKVVHSHPHFPFVSIKR